MMEINLRKGIVTLFLLLGFYALSYGQSVATWAKYDWLKGEWVGEGEGQPGQGEGTFSFKPDLDNRILVRKSHSVYPKAGNKPEIIHDDLMVIYPDLSGAPTKAIYFDNEGHTINYSVECSENSIVFTSNRNPGVPVFRLTYTLLDNKMVNTKFEMSRDGNTFITYVEGKSRKVNLMKEGQSDFN